jgi:2-dehydropantoate 2-reductase
MGEEPALLAGAGVVLVCVKSSATAEMAKLVADYAPPDAVVVSLQNGVGNAALLRQALPGRDVRAGVVEFNVVPMGDGRFHRSTSGDIVIGTGRGELGRALSVPGLVIRESGRIAAIQWGKLLINLNNAVNALSGLTLREMLLDRRWRRVMAAQMKEALNVLSAAKIDADTPAPVPASWLPAILRLPTPLFRLVARSMLTVDPHARSSMAQDLAKGRKTEVDALQGEITRLAAAHGMAAPICTRIAQLVRKAEQEEVGSPALQPQDLLG